jgi:hypothetical protein
MEGCAFPAQRYSLLDEALTLGGFDRILRIRKAMEFASNRPAG